MSLDQYYTLGRSGLRVSRLALGIFYFALGCAAAALLYWPAGFWCLAIPVLVAALVTLMPPRTAPAQT